MMTKLKFAMFALALAGSAPALAQENKGPIIGAWRMTSLQITDSQGKKTDVPYSGQVVFSQSGTLSVQAMDQDPAAKPTTYTANGYEAYYGPVAVDEEKRTFTITVESSLVRNLIGQELVRVFEVAGDHLVITPVDPEEGWRVTYERL
ncbi:lipocalin-like domain-containing protein [Mesorhizobium sp.]|uniref:lipocalin-like domain-containing protein n=1 Tax=Mesorhizobium sp. TaxID=1871066 RepID=UPI00257963A2|nr:lipocalin-like domain-containing protein [Mesorhizobium sp.]